LKGKKGYSVTQTAAAGCDVDVEPDESSHLSPYNSMETGMMESGMELQEPPPESVPKKIKVKKKKNKKIVVV